MVRISHNTDDVKGIAEDIIKIFKENEVLKLNGKYKKLYDDLCEFLRGLLE